MMIFKKAIPRRAFLRGVGGLAALPLLDAMVPAFASAAGQPVVRTSFVYFPNGMIPNAWKPKGEGASFEWSRILEPLAPFRDQALVLSGLDSREALGIPGEAGGEHPRASGAFLTCVHPVVRSVTGRFEPHVGVSVDQIIAEEFGRHTQLASLELGIESGNEVGSCDGDSCLYNSTVSWRDATTPNPIENHPRAVFERLFGDTESTSQKERLARIREKRSILDFVTQDVDPASRRASAPATAKSSASISTPFATSSAVSRRPRSSLRGSFRRSISRLAFLPSLPSMPTCCLICWSWRTRPISPASAPS